MGFHATIGNRQTAAPHVKASPRVTGYAQQLKFHANAGPVRTAQTDPIFSDTSMTLALMLADRRITRLTATMRDWRKAGTRWTLKLRDLGADIIVRKINSKEFTGWQAELIEFGQKRGIVLAQMAKGDSIETNKEREDTCRHALNMVHLVLQAQNN